MWDLNHAERRAVAASLILVGLAGVGRAWWAPSSGAVGWSGLPGGSSPLDSVEAALAAEARATAPLKPGERIDVNEAPEPELRRLPGIGPGLAAAIVQARGERAFASPADLERVPGIGPATRARLEPHVLTGSAPAGGTDPGPGGVRAGGGSRRARIEGPVPCAAGAVNVNRASRAELESLPGIGPALAGRIIDHRARHGSFRRPDDLSAVRGIGPRSVARLASSICAG